jgi:hypothetical protein
MMTPEDLGAIVGPLVTDAVSFVDSVLSPERAKATAYYNGEPFGNEEEGRSQVILTEVRDTISGIVPDLQRIFFGPERVVEFLPKTAEAVANAKQQTDYVHYCFTERNNGFLESLAVLKDGLTRKLGIFKTWWDESSDTKAYTLKGVTDDELTLLVADEKVTLLGVKADDEGTNTAHITRMSNGRLRVKAIPPEEFLYNRSARDTDTGFIFLGHRTRKTRGELRALGISKKLIDEAATAPTSLDTNIEAIEREPTKTVVQQDASGGEANDLFEYTELYMHVDVDGDGQAELRQVCTLGASNKVVNGDGLGEPVDDHPFALFIPDPEPHTLHGGSLADRVMDLQLSKSSILRAQFDSLSASIFSRMAYVEGQANVNDILNSEIGAPIRMRSQGAVQPLNIPFSGEVATPILQYLDTVVERRTGRSKGAEGLDLDALQSTTSQGVDAAVAGSRAQTEMLARVFAEMTLKPLFRRMYRLLKMNQPAEKVRLRDQVTDVDPSVWEDELDVSVNVAIGSTLIEKKLATIGAALAKQEQILQTLGPDNPIVSLPMYAATLQRGVELGGFRDVESFFKSVDPNWKPAPQPPEPSPEMAMVQVEQQKAAHTAQMKEIEVQQSQQQFAQKLAQEQAKLRQEFVLAQEKLRQEMELKVAEMQAQFGFDANQAEMQNGVERAKIDAENQREAARIAAANDRHRYETDRKHERELESIRLEHERAREEAARAASQAKAS